MAVAVGAEAGPRSHDELRPPKARAFHVILVGKKIKNKICSQKKTRNVTIDSIPVVFIPPKGDGKSVLKVLSAPQPYRNLWQLGHAIFDVFFSVESLKGGVNE